MATRSVVERHCRTSIYCVNAVSSLSFLRFSSISSTIPTPSLSPAGFTSKLIFTHLHTHGHLIHSAIISFLRRRATQVFRQIIHVPAQFILHTTERVAFFKTGMWLCHMQWSVGPSLSSPARDQEAEVNEKACHLDRTDLWFWPLWVSALGSRRSLSITRSQSQAKMQQRCGSELVPTYALKKGAWD